MTRRFLIVAMPALNEEATISDVIDRIPMSIRDIDQIQIVVIDDGSSDATAELATSHGAKVLRHSSQRGVGAAFQTAVRYAVEHQATYLATLDSDGQFSPEDLPKLLRPVVDGEAEFATASRFKDPDLVPEMPEIKKWGNRKIAQLISRLTGQKFFDVSCGMRCYDRKALLSLNLVGEFTYTQEVFLNLAFKKMRIVEVPIKVRGEREFGKSRVASSVTRYAINSSRIIWRAYRDYRPLNFFRLAGSRFDCARVAVVRVSHGPLLFKWKILATQMGWFFCRCLRRVCHHDVLRWRDRRHVGSSPNLFGRIAVSRSPTIGDQDRI